MTKILPTLYKKTSTGAIQQWTIAVEGPAITTTYGQVGGTLQSTTDILKEGKNAGKANATTAAEQAVKEAEAKHLKQKKKGYVDTVEGAEDDEVDDVIEGGYKPMLAKVWGEHCHKIDYAKGLYLQRKLNGHRGIGTGESGKVELWSRTRKRVTSMPHIIEELDRIYQAVGDSTWKPDGELYVHGMTFEQLTHYIRHEEPQPGHEKIEYHVYDMVDPASFEERSAKLAGILGKTSRVKVVCVPTYRAEDQAEVLRYHRQFRGEGYEGTIGRRSGKSYENKRTDYLLKLKDWKDEDFRALRIEESRGRYAGTAKRVVCELPDGREFTATMSGSIEFLRDLYEHQEKIIGHLVNTQFFDWTADGKPLHPVGDHIKEVQGCLA